MCGISGCIIRNNSEVLLKSKTMLEALDHRGPDGNGYWSDYNNILFCHTRLAIQDLSDAGLQPMISANDRYVITFNGEIYNFKNLKKELLGLGHTFASRTDTEVILNAIDEWGAVSTLKRLKGMFALAVWDKCEKLLTLARDAIGEKPLYYGWDEEGFFFASELKALTAISNSLILNQSIIPDFLTLGYIPTPYTIYNNVYKLVPGTLITVACKHLNGVPDDFSPFVGAGNVAPFTYWDLLNHVESDRGLICDPEEAVCRIEDTLMASIRDQLVSDVPVGAFLSGGIDSSLVVALMQKVASGPVKTFTIGFQDKQFNEAIYAKQIASHLETEHTEIYIDPNECLPVIERLPVIYDEPFADPSQLPTVLVCETARKYVTVCLSGDGGDELFAGYNRYILSRIFLQRCRWVPFVIKRMFAKILMSIRADAIDTGYKKVKKSLCCASSSQINVGLKWRKIAKMLQAESDAELYGFLLRLSNFNDTSVSSKRIIDKRIAESFSGNRPFVEAAMLTDQLNYLPDDNLTKVDRAAMSCALETRLPLISKDMIELSWKVPWQLKMRGGVSKWPLRQILYKHVPQQLIDRPKMGFSVPVSDWIRNELKDWSYALIQNLDSVPVAQKKYWQVLWDEHQAGRSDNGLALWPALMLSQWLHHVKS